MPECLCGCEIPESGTDFEPGCRHCERLHLHREIREVMP